MIKKTILELTNVENRKVLNKADTNRTNHETLAVFKTRNLNGECFKN